jgi:cyclase
MLKRGLIIARFQKNNPESERTVAEIFAQSDSTELPGLVGVRHRSLFVFNDLYIHLVETDDDFDGSVARVHDHPLFKEISAQLEPHIQAYDPATWRAPQDAFAREFYSWDAPLQQAQEKE